MEIEFELESGLVCDFEPDFEYAENYSVFGEVHWELQDGNHSGTVASLLDCSSEYEYPPAYLLPSV